MTDWAMRAARRLKYQPPEDCSDIDRTHYEGEIAEAAAIIREEHARAMPQGGRLETLRQHCRMRWMGDLGLAQDNFNEMFALLTAQAAEIERLKALVSPECDLLEQAVAERDRLKTALRRVLAEYDSFDQIGRLPSAIADARRALGGSHGG